MKVALFDFEMSNLDADFGVILCGCIYDYGREKLKTFSISKYAEKYYNDNMLVSALRQELEKYDIIVGYNSKRFDIPFLRSRLLYHNLRDIKPQKHIDLFWELRNKLKLHNKMLLTISNFLNGYEKTNIRGEHWIKAIAGDKKSLNYIIKHCQKDVMVLVKVFEKTKHLNTKIFTD